MKKLIAALAVLLAVGTTNLFAFGIGVQGGANLGAGGGAGALTFKLNDAASPIFAVDVTFGGEHVGVGLTADYWIANPKITGGLGWFYGVGLAGSVVLGDPVALSVGARALAGLNWFLLDGFLELYAQVAWQPMLHILPDVDFNLIYFPVSAGIRFWF